MPAPKQITHKDVVTENTKLTASANVDGENGLLEALIDQDDGIMRPGAMPMVTAASAAGSKCLLDAVAKVAPACFTQPSESTWVLQFFVRLSIQLRVFYWTQMIGHQPLKLNSLRVISHRLIRLHSWVLISILGYLSLVNDRTSIIFGFSILQPMHDWASLLGYQFKYELIASHLNPQSIFLQCMVRSTHHLPYDQTVPASKSCCQPAFARRHA